ncbi:D-alanyl-D-alanine carboxypeptidase [Arsenicitalea aurantiaca]|nr:D-alanyl-D-alanine carboxypeptidase [Arsenicitalea aurantiaca]
MASSAAKTPTRQYLSRILFAIITAVTLLGATAANAQGIENLRKYAGIVVDAKSGKVLYEENADARRYPASLSKVMTLYIVFQELNAGNLRLDTKMTVSRHAAAAVPTKLGLRAGSTITVENAIKSLVTLSANDMARVVAEHISGSESRFAERMTATARALGMNRTTYRNASGLPDGAQITTARDQAILGIAVYQHFPKYYEFFQTKSFTYNGRTYGNHNRLLGSNGVDGIKTGYINAAGSNLLTAARQSNRHIVITALGFNSSAARDTKVRELVRTYLPRGRQGDYVRTAMIPEPGRRGSGPVLVAQPRPVTPMPYPSFRNAQQDIQLASVQPAPVPAAPPVQAEIAVASIGGSNQAVDAANALGAPSSAPVPAAPPADVIGAWISETLALGAAPVPLGQTRPSAPLVPPVSIGPDGAEVDPMTSGSIAQATATPEMQAAALKAASASAAETAPMSVTGWIVQVGATPTETGASSLITDATSRISGLETFRPYVERFERNGQIFYRARFSGFDDRDSAANMCNELKKADLNCLAMQS